MPRTTDSNFSFSGDQQQTRVSPLPSGLTEETSDIQSRVSFPGWCQAPSATIGGGLSPPTPTVISLASQKGPTYAETNFIIKLLEAHSAFPKLEESGSPADKALKLREWRTYTQMWAQSISTSVAHWWGWIMSQVENTYQLYMKSDLGTREDLCPAYDMTEDWRQLDSMLREKFLRRHLKRLKLGCMTVLDRVRRFLP